MLFGVVRSNYDVQTGIDAHDDSGHCFYSTGNGKRFPGWADWEGREPAKRGDRVALLLDRDAGSMTVCSPKLTVLRLLTAILALYSPTVLLLVRQVYKNDRLLGVMEAGGLTGEYRWAVAMSHQDSCARVECLPPRHFIELEEAKAMAQRAEELKEKEKQQALRRKEREKQLQQEKEREEQEELERAEAAIARLEGRRRGGIE